MCGEYCPVLEDVCTECVLLDEDDKYSGKMCTLMGGDVDEMTEEDCSK